MVKIMLLLARREGTSPDDFAHHLQATHLPLVRQLPGLRRLVLNHIQPVPDAPPTLWDAISEDWFESPDALQAALASPQGQAVNTDAATFLDLSKLHFFVLDEHEITLAPGA